MVPRLRSGLSGWGCPVSGQCLRIDGGVLLFGEAIEAARYAVEVAQRSRARNGLLPLRSLEVLLQVLSPRGRADVEAGEVLEDESRNLVMVTTEEAARLLGCSPRQARRLAPCLDGTLAGGRWLLDRQSVLDHIAGRETRE